MKRIFLIPIIIQVVCALAMGQEPLNNGQAARQVFTGTWKANVAKSQRDPNHQFKSLTLIVEFSEDAVLLTYKGVNAAGKEEVGTTKLYPDLSGIDAKGREFKQIVIFDREYRTTVMTFTRQGFFELERSS